MTMPLKENITMVSKAVEDALYHFEGNKTEGYVPLANKSNSGVTIAKGFDLGQTSAKEMRSKGYPESLIQKFSPYFGKKKQDAVNALDATPLTITEAERDYINSKLIPEKAQLARDNYEKYVGFNWDDLPEHAQDALTIASFQLGRGLYKNKDKPTDLVGQLQQGAMTGDFQVAADNLSTWNKKAPIGLQQRYKATADLLAGLVTTDNVTRRGDMYKGALRDGTIGKDFRSSDDFRATLDQSNADNEIVNALGAARGGQVINDMAQAETVGNPYYTNSNMWDDIGSAIDNVRGWFGSAPDPQPFKQYEIKAGDNLSLIAKKLNTTVDKLVTDNGITDPNKIRAGQVLDY